MTTGLRVIITDTRSNAIEERVFAQFPVRIGRNPLNDLRLTQPFVSQFHAVLELQGGALMLRDLGSRNGTMLPSGRAPTHQPVELASSDGHFVISTLSFEARVGDIGEVVEERAPQKGLLLGGLFAEKDEVKETLALDMDSPEALQALARFGKRKPPAVPPSPEQAAALAPGPPALPPGATAVQNLVHQYVAARGVTAKVVQKLSAEATGLAPTDRDRLFSWAREAFPGLGDDTEFQSLVQFHGSAVSKTDSSSLAHRMEYVALQAVRELATLYVPGAAPPTSEEDLVRFLTKVRDSLDMFVKCFIPLRDGYRQFKTDMDIRGMQANFDTPAGHAQRAVEKARKPRALAELLLQWNDDSTAAHKAVEGAFADLMIHQLALLSGVMKGVKSLVDELSPTTSEKAAEGLQKKGKTGWMWGPYRYRELWKVYSSRHADVSDGEKQLYQLIFGSDFARAYAQLLGEAAAQGPGAGADKS